MIVKSVLYAVATFAVTATPALANDGVPAATIQLSNAIDTSDAVLSDSGDQEFRELFASWEALDEGGRIDANGMITAAPRLAVSVPSRMPVESLRMTSGYGDRNHPILRQRRRHNGVDLAAPRGTPVYATADGRVGQAEWFGSYGNYVRIEHGGDLHTRYGHLSSYTVTAGDYVHKGDLIGYIGSTGRSTGPHLHYEVRIGEESVNPLPYMTPQFASVDQVEGATGGPE